ncbi:MAG: SPASM domain-containing protein [Alphaproteobacteria bacterium]|nr:SPASM domain-containing protein [Alphaproteobacteria bacterium]
MRSRRELLRDSRMYLSRRLNRSLAPPDRVSVNLTLRCNLTCEMCTTCYDSPELSTDEVKAIIDQTAAWGVEVFNPLGGEPFMRADIEEILAYAVKRGFYVTVTTNGTLITEKRARAIAAIAADRLHVNISLDGDQPVNDGIRGPGMWKRAIAGYQRIRDADARAGNSRRKMLANTILNARNIDHFPAVLDEQAALGFDGVQILNLFRGGPDVPEESRDLWFTDAHLPRLEVLAETLARRAETQPDAGYRIQNDPADLRKIPRYYRDELGPLEAPCWAGWKELYINADGQAIMCDGSLDFLAGAFGNVREQTLRQLWASPELKQRRQVVKQCTTPCIQDCYLRTRSDSGRELLGDAASMGAELLRARMNRLRATVDEHPDAVLHLELSDVVEAGAPGCTTPLSRWERLVAGAPLPPAHDSWAELRDKGYLDFGRGFMGFEVVRTVCEDLRDASLRFGTLALRWRGEPLLHPEIEPILHYLVDAIGRGEVASRLAVETSGRFLTDGLARIAGADIPQDWVIDLDRAGEDALRSVALLEAAAGPQTRILLAVRATAETDPVSLRDAFPGFRPAAGRMPTEGRRVLWARRTDHDHFLANRDARESLRRVAEAWSVPAELGEEDRPRRCTAPWTTPTVSWDGKVVLCPRDVRLDQKVGEVTSGRLSELWRGPALRAARRECDGAGVPDRALCRDCPLPWSPNLPERAP